MANEARSYHYFVYVDSLRRQDFREKSSGVVIRGQNLNGHKSIE